MIFDLTQFLSFASTTTPAYFAYRGAALEQFPITTKTDYRKSYIDYLSNTVNDTDKALILDRISSLLRYTTNGPREFRAGTFYLERSSGTSGPCVWFPRSPRERVQLSLTSLEVRRNLDPEFSINRFLDLNIYFNRADNTEAVNVSEAAFKHYSTLQTAGIRYV